MEVAESKTISNQLDCRDCGALLKYAPGTLHLNCEYCGAANEIKSLEEQVIVEETDFEQFISTLTDSVADHEIHTVSCKNCGASTTLKSNVTADNCPFCDTSLVVDSAVTTKVIKPRYLLPFKIKKNEAASLFKKWINDLWFAPNDLSKAAQSEEKIQGVYIPYWTYDADTMTSYSGERGDNYQTTETYTATINGESVTKTRTVTKTRWSYVSGSVGNNFNDVLVLASKSLPDDYTSKLEPWDLEGLQSFDEKFISGFKSESYQVDVKEGFSKAKTIMAPEIEKAIKYDIGGDHQRISSSDTQYSEVKFKHILLPVWLSAYRYKQKVYRFMVNGRTGEVQGERPWSAAKIAALVISILGIIGGAVWYFWQ